MLVTIREAFSNWRKLKSVSREIMATARKAPAEMSPYARHLKSRFAMVSNCYYVGLLTKFAGTPNKVVDWGGGLGQITALAQQQFADVDCFLVEMGEIERYWHEKLTIRSVRSSVPGEPVNKINYPDGSVDVVISSGVLEHTYEYGIHETDALKEIHRVLSSSGKLFIWNLPTKWGLIDNLHKLFGGFYHHRRYTLDEVHWLLIRCGFEINQIEKNDFLLPRLKEWASFVLPPEIVFVLDNILSRLPIFSIFASNFTIVATKRHEFVFSPSYDGAVVSQTVVEVIL